MAVEQVSWNEGENGRLVLRLSGRLDARTTGGVWREAIGRLDRESPSELVVDASDLEYCDGSGAAFLAELERRLGDGLEIRDFPESYEKLREIYDAEDLSPLPPEERTPFLEEVGAATVRLLDDLRAQVLFTGRLLVALAVAVRHPRRIRYGDALYVAETAGANAVPIILVIGFLLGLVLAFQSAQPMKEFGAEIYVADLLGASLVRELGPLMTAIVLAGRTGSAFAAEIGTMKVNEEIDALSTMGLDPVQFLTVTRILATVAMAPILACFCIVAGFVGGAPVMLSLGFPLSIYVDRIFYFVEARVFVAGMVKTVVFAILVTGIGCHRGLRTTTGAKAVGESTTSAVVSGILLIAIADAVFALILYALEI